MTLRLLIDMAKNLHLILLNSQELKMTVAELNDKLAALKTSLDALAAAHATGINPADLDAVGASIDALKAEADAAVTPPAA